MDTDEYIRSHFEEFVEGGEFSMMSTSYRSAAESALRTFDTFMETRQRSTEVTKSHLVCYMLYRVVGEEGDDRLSGSCSLRTFQNSEIGPLCHILRFNERIDFTAKELYLCGDYRDKVALIKNLRSESGPCTHARPMYAQDEERLRRSLTCDTASKRDEAIIVLSRASGSRSAAIGFVMLRSHVEEKQDGSVCIVIPGVKTRNDLQHRVVLLGEDAAVLKRWIRARRQLVFPNDVGFLFVTRAGTAVDTNNITQMLYTLGNCAGYGPKFFSSHAFRTGYANRVGAEILARGGCEYEISMALGDGTHWAPRSAASRSYIDPNLRNFFRDGYRMSLEDFQSLDPETLHDLVGMYPAQQRVLDWFQHSPARLRALCERLGIAYVEAFGVQQVACRKEIGIAMQDRFPSFRLFVLEAAEVSGRAVPDILQLVVGCLLEDEEIEVARWTMEPHRGSLLAALSVRRNAAYSRAIVKRAQCTQIHELLNARQAKRLRDALCRRIYDRKLHLGRLPSGLIVLLRVRPIEEDIEQVADIPLFDLPVHFPGQSGARPSTGRSVESADPESDSSQDVPPPYPLRQPAAPPSTPLRPSILHSATPSTTATSAASPLFRC